MIGKAPRMLIAHDVIDSLTKHERFKEALEELAVHPMSEFGVPSVANTFTAHLDAGKRTVRIRIEMVPEGQMFPDDMDQ